MLKAQFKDTITQGQIRLPQSNLKKKKMETEWILAKYE